MTPFEKGRHFQELHRRGSILLIPNPWDAGSAKMLTKLGFEALATSSGAAAATQGRRDGKLSREEALVQARAIVEATSLPVSADLENGFGDSPEAVAETIRLAAEAGLVGASIEDHSADPAQPLFPLTLAKERIAAAVQAARALPFPFTLTARAENYFRGHADLDDVLARLHSYQEAGADVLFAPALPSLEAVRTVCSSLEKPVNFMVGIKGRSFSVAELAEAGVGRISFASSLYRAAMTGLLDAAQEIREGLFTYLDKSMTTPELNEFLA